MLFLSDFANTLKMHSEMELVAQNGDKVTLISQAYLDYNSKSAFVGFFIPSETKDAAAVIAYLSGVDAESLRHTSVKTSGGMAGQMTNQDDLVFTGRVYIYHEPDLSIEQRASLIQVFRAKHLDVQFRGNDYMLMRFLEEDKNKKEIN